MTSRITFAWLATRDFMRGRSVRWSGTIWPGDMGGISSSSMTTSTIWSVSHDADKGIKNLVMKGEPPPTLSAIRDRLCSQQAAEDADRAAVDYIFDIPVELAQSLTGYRHDEDTPALPKNSFEVLQPTRKPSKLVSWLRSFK